MKNSEYISGFLTFLYTLQSDCRVARLNEEEAGKETQDILHKIELCNNSYEDMAEMAIGIKAVRQKRRCVKDIIIAANPILKWVEENSKAIKSLEKCLGETRKAEQGLENRQYVAKTDIMTHILGHSNSLWIEEETKHEHEA